MSNDVNVRNPLRTPEPAATQPLEAEKPNSRRHVLGLLTGLVATAVIAGGLMYSVDRQELAARSLQLTGSDHWTAVSLIVVAGLVIALLSGSRLSPLASLLPGLVFAAIGGIRAASPTWTGDHTLVNALPAALRAGYQAYAGSGLFLMIGVAMVGASLFPSRWRARVPKSGGRHSFDDESPKTVPVHEDDFWRRR